MPVVDVRGFDLQQNLGDRFARGFSIGQGFREAQRRRDNLDRSAQIRETLGEVGQEKPVTQQQQQIQEQSIGFENDPAIQPPGRFSQQELIQAARKIDPTEANRQIKELGFDTPTKLAEASRFATTLQNTPFESRRDRIIARARSLEEQGRNPKDTLELLDFTEQEQNQSLLGVNLLDLSTKDSLTLSGRSQGDKFKREALRLRQRESELRELEIRERLVKSELGRANLREKIIDRKRKIEQGKKDARFEAQSTVSSVQDTIETIDRMMEGSALESATGAESFFPTFPGTEAANFEAILETLQSQAFLSQVKKMAGMGGLSENEGKKLGAAIGSLNITMGDNALRKELSRIRGKLIEAKATMEEKFSDILQPSVADVPAKDLDDMSLEDLIKLRESVNGNTAGN